MRVSFTIILFISLLLLENSVQAENISYKMITERKIDYETSTISSNDVGFSIETEWKGFKFITHTDFDHNTLRWESINEKKEINVIFKRIENFLEATGVYKGKLYEKKFSIDKNPWFQDWNLGLKNFVFSDKPSISFWSIEPEELMVTKFKAIRGKITNISINGENLETLHLKVTLEGFAGMFWHADYWFRKSDGRMVISRMAQGAGVPITTTELYKENP